MRRSFASLVFVAVCALASDCSADGQHHSFARLQLAQHLARAEVKVADDLPSYCSAKALFGKPHLCAPERDCEMLLECCNKINQDSDCCNDVDVYAYDVCSLNDGSNQTITSTSNGQKQMIAPAKDTMESHYTKKVLIIISCSIIITIFLGLSITAVPPTIPIKKPILKNEVAHLQDPNLWYLKKYKTEYKGVMFFGHKNQFK